MNLRHAAALALAGWYLMVPPVDEESRLLIDASFSELGIASLSNR